MGSPVKQLTEIELDNAAIDDQLIWRRKCRKSLVEFARTMPIPGVPQTDNYEQLLAAGALDRDFDDGRYDDMVFTQQVETDLAEHHSIMLETNQKVIEGTLIAPDGSICKRAQHYMPPGSAKTTYCPVVTGAWAMGKYPGPIILAMYADMISKKHGKRARQLCSSPEYQAVFNTSLDPHTKAGDQWALMNGSEYLSSGILSGMAGNRAGGVFWDDLIKGRRAAESTAERLATWDAYRDDLRTRKIPTGWEIGVMTRWHQDDVPGHILPDDWAGESGFFKGKDGYWWYINCIQAEAEHASDPLGRKVGEYIWTEWFNTDGSPEDYWAPLKMDTRSWGSLFQQVPTPPEGDFYKLSWVRYYDHLPKELNKFVSGDYAVTAAEDADDPDLTSIGVWGMDSEGYLYFITGWHGQVDSADWTETAIDFFEAHKPLAHISGGGQIRRGTEPWMKKRMRDRKTFTMLEWYPETHGKEENARSFQGMMQHGMVLWPRGHEEAEFVIRHLIGFGTLRYDDPPDMCAFMGRHVAKLWEAKKPRVSEKKPIFKAGEMPITSIMPAGMRKQLKQRKVG